MHAGRHDTRSALRRRRSRVITAAILTLVALQPGVSGQDQTRDLLVMPFDNPQQDAGVQWLAEGSAVALAEFLERYGAAVVPRHERASAFERLQLPPAAALSHATVIKVGQFVGAAEVVIGAYDVIGDVLTVRARAIRLDAGRISSEIVERGPLEELPGVFERMARRLRGVDGPGPALPPGTLLTSPRAFELYVKGLVAESPLAQESYLEQAEKVAPLDDRIKLALWQVLADGGQHQDALAVAARVPAASAQARAARYLRARSQLELKLFDEAFDTLKALQSEVRSAAVLNAIGVVQLRRGATAETGRAVYYFSQATQLDPAGDHFFNLGYGYWLDKDPQAAIYWLREAVRRDPADGEAHLVLSAALQQAGAHAEAARELELAQRLSADVGPRDSVPRGLERINETLDRPRSRVDTVLSSTGQRDQTELATHHLEAGRRAIADQRDRDAEQELRRALYLAPYLAEAHLLLGRVYLRAGRAGDAVQAFKIALWSEESAAGHLGLAEAYLTMQNLAAAKDEVARALALDPASPEAKALRAKIGQ
jgi:tetratricopeptide (TPR) repeat protein